MSYEDVMKEVDSLKQIYGKLFTNIIPGAMKSNLEYEIIKKDEGLIIVAQEPHRKRGYFAVKDKDALAVLLADIPHNIFFEWLYRGENELEEIMNRVNIKLYATFFRSTRIWKGNPFEVQQEGRRVLLQEMYDSSCGEYADVEDAEELYELSKSVFDVKCDDVFTVEEWRERILMREVLVYREKDKITSCYVWHLDGKKLYSNISINLGAANILYNMERRIFTEMWEKGIRIYYSWRNIKNKKALSRGNKNTRVLLAREDIMYNAIYES